MDTSDAAETATLFVFGMDRGDAAIRDLNRPGDDQ